MTSFAADRARRTTQVDRWLAGMLGAEPGVALVAVGGYGRRELLPGSDLDVLLLHAGQDGIASIADRIWYPVWDSGARLDHAVRTVPQARRVARADIKVALGLLSARHVAGDPALTTQLREGALEDWRAAARTRLAELRDLHNERARIFGELAFLLEPDLKEARGGLRDVHAIQAIAAAWVASAPRTSRSWTPATSCTRSPGAPPTAWSSRSTTRWRAPPACWTGTRCCASLRAPGAPWPTPWITPSGKPNGPRAGGCGGGRWSAARSPTASSSRTARWCWPAPPIPSLIRSWSCGPRPPPPRRDGHWPPGPWPGWRTARRFRCPGLRMPATRWLPCSGPATPRSASGRRSTRRAW